MEADLDALRVRPVEKSEEARYRALMAQGHYLGDLAKIGHTLWYVATHGEDWAALLSFSAAAWKCGVRDRWIGWDYRHQYDRLRLIANNSRFLILPDWHHPNLGSRVLSLCQQRIGADWQRHFGQPLLLLETFVDPSRFQGTVYRAANWTCLGLTQGFRRTRAKTRGQVLFFPSMSAQKEGGRGRIVVWVLQFAACRRNPSTSNRIVLHASDSAAVRLQPAWIGALRQGTARIAISCASQGIRCRIGRSMLLSANQGVRESAHGPARRECAEHAQRDAAE